MGTRVIVIPKLAQRANATMGGALTPQLPCPLLLK
ncbi:MAG: hypothetical protein QOC70_2050 [Verrucomicrobiota bacterium]|jgi:hypothetical protein